jgi:hypothetical protein
MEWATLVTTALSGVTASFTDGITGAAPVILGIAALGLIFRKVRGLIR